MKLRTLALILALAAGCKSSESSTSAPSESGDKVAAGGASGEESKGRSGKIELPSIKKPDGAEQPAQRRDRRGDGQWGDRAERIKKWDTDGNGELSEAERAAMREGMQADRMKRMDTDGDGKVSEAEQEAARKARDDERAARDAARAERMDTDGDGKVSDEERAEARTERAANRHVQADDNEDGKLSVDELKNQRWFRGDPSKADLDGNGEISVEELKQAMPERGGRGERGRRGRRGGDAGSAE